MQTGVIRFMENGLWFAKIIKSPPWIGFYRFLLLGGSLVNYFVIFLFCSLKTYPQFMKKHLLPAITRFIIVLTFSLGAFTLEAQTTSGNGISEGIHDSLMIGYRTQERQDKTGAIDKVKSKEFIKGDITSPIQSLQGKVAGVTVSKTGGDPNSSYSVRIRGASTFDAGTQPFYVIDGIPNANPSMLSPDDIESMTILKDASSCAIYGVSGSDGVIIITTKRRNMAPDTAEGGSRKPFFNVELNAQFTSEKNSKKLDMLSAGQLREFSAQHFADSSHLLRDGGGNTDWQDELYKTRFSTRNRVSISAGNKHGSLLGSFSRNDMNGIMEGTGRHQTTGHLNGIYQAWQDRLTISCSLLGSIDKNDYQQYNGWGSEDVIYQALSRNPTDPVYDASRAYYNSSRVFNYENPLKVINQITNDGDSKHFTGGLNMGLRIVKGLVGTVNVGFTHDDLNYSYSRPAGFYLPSDNSFDKTYEQLSEQKLLEVTATYSTIIHKQHTIDVLGGYSWQQEVLKYDTTYGSPWEERATRIGLFGRAQYNFDHRYYLTASIRRDGNSKFGTSHKWGIFPALSAGWNIANEKFLKSVKWLDQVKLRVGYGVTGNDKFKNNHDALYFPGLATAPDITGVSSVTHKFFYDNYDLKWEETSEINAGLDYAFLHQRISGSIDVYSKQTKDILMNVPQPVPPNNSPYLYANSASFSGKGIEFTLRVLAVDKSNFSWNIALTVAHHQTKVVSLGYNGYGSMIKSGYLSGRGVVGDDYYVSGLIPGEEVGAFYLPKYAGLYQGSFIYEKINGGYTSNISQAQRYVVGSPSPKVELGWSNDLKLFKRWDLAFSFRCWIGNKIYNATRMFLDSPGNLPSLNTLNSALDWYDQGRLSGPELADFYVEDASFLKLDMVSLNYSFNLSNVKWIKDLNIFVTANNLLTITGYKGTDPEMALGGFSAGIDQYNVYPKSRSFTLGLKALF
jgi:iron complex outermembrane receptor protein